MKKLHFIHAFKEGEYGNIVITHNTECDWCGEESEECFQSVTVIDQVEQTNPREIWALKEGLNKGDFLEKTFKSRGIWDIEGEWGHFFPEKEEVWEKRTLTDRKDRKLCMNICKNCAKQIGKYKEIK